MNKKQILLASVIALISVSSLLFFNFMQRPETQKVKILCAGSLLNPLNALEASFEEDNPGIDAEIEGHGSIQVIRHPTELNDVADLLMVADYTLIPTMMYDTPLSDGKVNFTDWYIRFAGNQIVLAYTDESNYNRELNKSNWFKILSRSDVKIGAPNPVIDAMGYRTLMIMQLAEFHYDEDPLFEEVIGSNFDPAFEVANIDGTTYIFVPEKLDPDTSKLLLRASSVQVFPLLESGAIDYCFLYKSNAEQFGVDYLMLPDELNMGNQTYDDDYSRVVIRYQHARFQSIGLDRVGKTIFYGLTIPKNAENREGAIKFIEYLFSDKGKDVFLQQEHPIYEPAYTDNMESVPEPLQKFVIREK